MTSRPITDRLNAVGRYDMDTRPDTWPGADPSDLALEAYVNSGEFVQDALDWAGDHAHRHAALVETICDYYAESPECNAAIEDICDGVRNVA